MRILLVDDEQDIRKIAQLGLQAVGGHAVALADGAKAGIEMAQADPPDLILLDMMMPGMDGLQALVEIRGIHALAAVPVVFMTAKVQRNEIAEYLRAGAAGVIQKPFDPMTLSQDLEGILAGAASATPGGDPPPA